MGDAGRKIFVGNLNWEVTDREMRDAFAEVGGVEKAEIVRDAQGRSRGFGFVEFMIAEDAERALKLDGEVLRGREMRVQPAHARENRNREGARHARPGGRRWA